jgi:Bacterial protein of unknown function (DUF899)
MYAYPRPLSRRPAAALHAREVTLLLVSQAPLAKLQACKRRTGWSVPWVPAANTDFNCDFGASVTQEQVDDWGLDEGGQPPIGAQKARPEPTPPATCRNHEW